MSIRLAPAVNACANRFFGTEIPSAPANDGPSSRASDALLRAALLHFAQHGLGAADLARTNAETAFFAGDRAQYEHWLGICRLLDARMAQAVEFHGASGERCEA